VTSYNDILDTEIDPGSQVTTSVMARLRDNPIAITEGAPGAPVTVEAAITPGALTRFKLADDIEQRRIVCAAVEFDGEAPVTIVYSYNVIAITHHATGRYELHIYVTASQAFWGMGVTTGDTGTASEFTRGALSDGAGGQPASNASSIFLTISTVTALADNHDISFMGYGGIAGG
jgi:hypothetical protein